MGGGKVILQAADKYYLKTLNRLKKNCTPYRSFINMEAQPIHMVKQGSHHLTITSSKPEF